MATPSVTNPMGGLSITIISYMVLSLFNISSILGLIINSEGFGGIGPAVIKSNPDNELLFIHSSNVFLSIKIVLMPFSLLTLNTLCILGFRISKSKIITFFCENAIIPARLIATNVFPSPETVEVSAIIFVPSVCEIYCRLLRNVLKDSAINDLGFLSTTNCDTGISLS